MLGVIEGWRASIKGPMPFLSKVSGESRKVEANGCFRMSDGRQPMGQMFHPKMII